MELFGHANATYLQRISSDHSPLITSLLGSLNKAKAGFKYDHRLVQKEGFKDWISTMWTSSQSQGDTRDGMVQKIKDSRKDISKWTKQNKSNSSIRIQELHHQIDQITKATQIDFEELKRLKKELHLEHQNEETFWRMKSRVTWLKDGDRNTKFFHAATKNRRAQNKIRSLKDDQGKTWFAAEDLGRVA